jgi:hypothetical protein
MAEIVNLRMARKRIKRRKDEATAEENRIRHGRTLAERERERHAAKTVERHLDAHRLRPDDEP